jgi:hypothetical protein
MGAPEAILTASEVAADLRCSKAQVYKLIKGTVAGVPPLPAIGIGRRRVIRRSSLEHWKTAAEKVLADATLEASPEVDAVGASRSNR